MLTSVAKKTARKSVLIPVFAILLVLSIGLGTLLTIEQAHAFTPNYNWNDLIDNPTFTDTTTMSAGVIQTFLSNIGSGIANYSDVEACDSTIAPYYTHCGQTISAAQIIYDAAQAYGINPRVILATLEKEQSLVTDPTPSASQINCAMGYNSCSGAVGFFTQVDNGTWALKYNYEGAFQTAQWLSWSPGANYPCRNASNLYSAGLYPGNIATFANPGGTAETVNIANAATASLYCYTPYVGPYNVTGYSGSYNFVYYYQLWFGSTQTSDQYAWGWAGQGAYEDSAMTEEFDRGNVHASLTPGQTAYLQLNVVNNGYATWTQSVVRLGTSNPDNRCSIFATSQWLNCARVNMVQSSVIPGGTATFDFSITAPQTTGEYQEFFDPLAEGITWMGGPPIYFDIDVVQPRQAITTVNTLSPYGSMVPGGTNLLSPDLHSTFALQPNGDVVLSDDGIPLWSSNTAGYNTSSLIMQGDGNLVLYGNDGIADWNSGTDGNPGAYFVLQSDGNGVIYSSHGVALWSTGTAGVPDGLDYVAQSTTSGAELYPLQELSTPDGNYTMIVQPDGNLVVYYQGHPLWWTGTSGANDHLFVQGDGNLVLYNQAGVALWNSGTAGQGPSTLIMQGDGNLVLYNQAGVATWNSGTYGMK